MSDAWDGRPLNPERDGWHWLLNKRTNELTLASWSVALAHDDNWLVEGFTHWPETITSKWTYGQPAHTPAEVAALVDAARREERERCARVAETTPLPRHEVKSGPMAGWQTFPHEWPAAIAAAIRAGEAQE